MSRYKYKKMSGAMQRTSPDSIAQERSHSMFCVYMTIYLGDKMPNYYIGSTTLSRHQSGKYFGSVCSAKWGKIWKAELRENFHLFRTFLIPDTVVDTHKEALVFEEIYQRLFDVVNNPDFINQAYANSARSKSKESTQKRLETMLSRYGTLRTVTTDSVEKAKATRLARYGTLSTSTPDSIAKQLDTKKKNGTLHAGSTPEAIAKQLETKNKNGTTHAGNTPEAIAKQLETKKKNGTLKRSPECIAKMVSTRRARGNYKVSQEAIEKGKKTKLEKYGTLNSWTPEVSTKILDTKRKNGNWYNNTAESFKKAYETRKQNGTLYPSEETKAKMSATRKGRKMSDATKAKLREAKRGQK